MLNVVNKSIMLSVIMLRVVRLNVVAPALALVLNTNIRLGWKRLTVADRQECNINYDRKFFYGLNVQRIFSENHNIFLCKLDRFITNG